MSFLKFNCVDCGNEFGIGEQAQEAIKEKGWAMPKRCKECREAKKRRFASPFKPALDRANKALEGEKDV